MDFPVVATRGVAHGSSASCATTRSTQLRGLAMVEQPWSIRTSTVTEIGGREHVVVRYMSSRRAGDSIAVTVGPCEVARAFMPVRPQNPVGGELGRNSFDCPLVRFLGAFHGPSRVDTAGRKVPSGVTRDTVGFWVRGRRCYSTDRGVHGRNRA